MRAAGTLWRHARRSRLVPVLAACALVAVVSTPVASAFADQPPAGPADRSPAALASTTTPIKHLVVIFQENVSFDHYFGTYPNATNPPGEPSFTPAPGTPDVNGLSTALLTHNGNLSNPQRLDPSQALTCDQDHGYTAEQAASDGGAMDQFVQKTGAGLTLAQCLAGLGEPMPTGSQPNFAAMDYYDGNTVTALWNYAQHYAMDDNAYGTAFGPSTPGALEVTAGNTFGAVCGPSRAVVGAPACAAGLATTPGAVQPAGPGTVFNDSDPYYDVCSAQEDHQPVSSTIAMGGRNIGNVLDASNLTWGWFQGGFDAGYVPGQGTPPAPSQVCAASHANIGGATVKDYSPHHEPFQYFASTANPDHLPPTSVAAIGHQDQANHQYDLADFWAAADAGTMPAVSYLKAPAYQDGHAGYSDPIDEQHFLVDTINRLESLPSWKSTAVVITYDDSDGWYDHQLGPIVNQSQSPLDVLTGAGSCGSNPAAVPTSSTGAPEQGRCGYGPRLPFLVISPYSKVNTVSNTLLDQSSVVRFIETNWRLPSVGNGSADTEAGPVQALLDFHRPPARPVFLDPTTGEVVAHGPARPRPPRPPARAGAV